MSTLPNQANIKYDYRPIYDFQPINGSILFTTEEAESLLKKKSFTILHGDINIRYEETYPNKGKLVITRGRTLSEKELEEINMIPNTIVEDGILKKPLSEKEAQEIYKLLSQALDVQKPSNVKPAVNAPLKVESKKTISSKITKKKAINFDLIDLGIKALASVAITLSAAFYSIFNTTSLTPLSTGNDINLGTTVTDVTSIGKPAADVTSIGKPAADVTSIGKPAADVTSIGKPAADVTNLNIPEKLKSLTIKPDIITPFKERFEYIDISTIPNSTDINLGTPSDKVINIGFVKPIWAVPIESMLKFTSESPSPLLNEIKLDPPSIEIIFSDKVPKITLTPLPKPLVNPIVKTSIKGDDLNIDLNIKLKTDLTR